MLQVFQTRGSTGNSSRISSSEGWTERMDDAWTGAMTDVIHDAWTGCTDNAQMGAATDVSHDVWMDCMDDAQMGTMKTITYDVQTDGDFTGISWR